MPPLASEPLLPVYLLGGSDRPKVVRALRRLRSRFAEASVELLSAEGSTGADAVAGCNALGLFANDGGRLVIVEDVDRWRKNDVEAIAAYLGEPTPGAVLALVAHEPSRASALGELAAKHGRVLTFEVPKPRELPRWVQEQFERQGATIEREAARTLVELVGDDVVALASEVEKLSAWAGRAEIRTEDVERLAVRSHETAPWAISDAWGNRDVGFLLATCEAELEHEKPFLIAARLAAHVGRVRSVQALSEEGLAPREVGRRLRMHEYAVRKALGHARNYSRDELDQAVVRLAALDLAVKGASRLSGELELERALIELASPAERERVSSG